METVEMEQRFRQLRKALTEGAINDEEFKAEVERLRFVDEQGREWMIGAYSGKWYYLDQDGEWVQGAPSRTVEDGDTCQTCGRPVKVGMDFCDDCLAQKKTIPTFNSVPVETIGGQPERSRVPWAILVIAGLFVIGAMIFWFVSFGRPMEKGSTVQAIATAPETAESQALTASEGATAATVAEAATESAVTPAPTIAEATTTPTATVAEAAAESLITSTPFASQVSTLTVTAPLSSTAASSPSPAAGSTEAATPSPTSEPTDTATLKSSPSPTSVEATAVPTTEELTPTPELLPRGVIAFPVFDPERATYDIYTIKADGSDRQKVISDASQPAFSPDGTKLAFRSWDPTKRGLFVHDFTGEHIDWQFSTFGPASRPEWASNGQFFLFHSRQESDRESRLYRTVGTELRTIRRPDVNKDIYGKMPALLTDSRFIYNACEFGKCGLITRDINGSYPQHLTEDPGDTAPAPSPDGEQIAFMSRRDGNWEIYIMNADGSGMTRLTENGANDGLPAWSPDGAYLAFVSDRGKEWAVWIMRPDGSAQRQFFALGGSLDGRVRNGHEHDTLGWIEERISWKP